MAIAARTSRTALHSELEQDQETVSVQIWVMDGDLGTATGMVEPDAITVTEEDPAVTHIDLLVGDLAAGDLDRWPTIAVI